MSFTFVSFQGYEYGFGIVEGLGGCGHREVSSGIVFVLCRVS